MSKVMKGEGRVVTFERSEKFYKEAHKFYSDASAGRMASETQR